MAAPQSLLCTVPLFHQQVSLYRIILTFAFSRFDYIWEVPPWRNQKLLPTLLVMLMLAVGSGLSILAVTIGFENVSAPPALWWSVAASSLVMTVAISEATKALQRSQHRSEQKFLKLLFQTRLGMWSPK